MLRRKLNSLSRNGVKGLLLTLLLTSLINSQPFTTDEKKVLEMQDKRIVNYDITWLNSQMPEDNIKDVRNILSIYNISDTVLYNKLFKMYTASSTPDDQKLYLEALANIEINSKELGYRLLKDNPGYNQLTFRILSSYGDEESLNEITKQNLEIGIKTYFIKAIYNYSKRRVGSFAAFEKAKDIISDGYKFDERMAYALNRTAILPAISLFKDELKNNFSSTDYASRMWSFSAIGKLQDTADVSTMLTSLADEKDWRVKVNIITSLGNYKIDNTSPLLNEVAKALVEQAVNGGNTHVAISALQALGKLFTGADTRDMTVSLVKEQLLFLMMPESAVDWQIKAEAVKAYGKIFKDEAKADLLTVFASTDNYDVKAAAVNAFGFMNDAMVYKELRDIISVEVNRYNTVNPNKDGSMIGSPDLAKIYKAFVEALAELDNRLDAENRNITRLIFSEFASSKNAPIVDICLANLSDSLYIAHRPETCQVMMFDYDAMKHPQDKDVMLMYIETWGKLQCDNAKELLTANLKHADHDIAKASADALKSITGNDYEKEINAPKYKHDFDWKFIDNLESKKYASLVTSKGTIVIELAPEIAPFTVQSFVKLGEKGFYNNTIFHRVVPNFVIQGGDPTGSGYGGPGYSIRSEFSPLPYEAYTVGMASSGKDTEGSQFFITHSPQPHLEGRYTVFGKVVDGFDIVDNIQIGDKIESISFSSSR